MNPIIGIISAVDTEKTTTVFLPYVHCIEQSGGIPVILPYTAEKTTVQQYISLCHGFLFSGGVDENSRAIFSDFIQVCLRG